MGVVSSVPSEAIERLEAANVQSSGGSDRPFSKPVRHSSFMTHRYQSGQHPLPSPGERILRR